MDCPTLDYLNSLINNPRFEPYKWKDDDRRAGEMAPTPATSARGDWDIVPLASRLSCMLHYSPHDVVTSPLYVRWMER